MLKKLNQAIRGMPEQVSLMHTSYNLETYAAENYKQISNWRKVKADTKEALETIPHT